jgi:basic amino acid/polyamine antiporter, APA family
MAVAPQPRNELFATKPVDALVADTEDAEHQLRRAVGALDLTALGLGAIIGTGIFVVIGEAIGDAGPAIILSFVLAGVTCAFSALCFAELASTIPVAGSAYTYSYATMGELVAWIIGWDLVLEYAVSVAAVSVGWGQYFNDLLDSLFGLTLPESIAGPPGEGGVVNVPAVSRSAPCRSTSSTAPRRPWPRWSTRAPGLAGRRRSSRSARWWRSPASCSRSSTRRRGSCSRCRATG